MTRREYWALVVRVVLVIAVPWPICTHLLALGANGYVTLAVFMAIAYTTSHFVDHAERYLKAWMRRPGRVK